MKQEKVIMSIDEFVVKMSTSVEFETRFGDLLCESSDFCLQLRTLMACT